MMRQSPAEYMRVGSNGGDPRDSRGGVISRERASMVRYIFNTNISFVYIIYFVYQMDPRYAARGGGYRPTSYEKGGSLYIIVLQLNHTHRIISLIFIDSFILMERFWIPTV